MWQTRTIQTIIQLKINIYLWADLCGNDSTCRTQESHGNSWARQHTGPSNKVANKIGTEIRNQKKQGCNWNNDCRIQMRCSVKVLPCLTVNNSLGFRNPLAIGAAQLTILIKRNLVSSNKNNQNPNRKYYLLRLIFVDKLLPFHVWRILPHLRDDARHLPELQFGIGRLHGVPHLAAVPHERHQRLFWRFRGLGSARINLQ